MCNIYIIYSQCVFGSYFIAADLGLMMPVSCVKLTFAHRYCSSQFGLVFIMFQLLLVLEMGKFEYQNFLFTLWLNISLHCRRPKVDKVIF